MTEPLHQNQEKALLLKIVLFISHEVTIDNAHRPEPDGTEERTKQNPNQQPDMDRDCTSASSLLSTREPNKKPIGANYSPTRMTE